jgi:pilus assembly protein CpaE
MNGEMLPIRKSMLRAAVIASKPSITQQVREILAFNESVEIGRSLDFYPSEVEVIRFLQAHAPSIMFVDFESVETALGIVSVIERTHPGTQVIALQGGRYDPEVLMKAMRVGIREVLEFPLNPDTVKESLKRVLEILKQRPLSIRTTESLFCFLPAKPGGGASTIAVNTSSMLAKLSGEKTLLMDLDLSNGVSSFLLKLNNSNSVCDALERASQMDDSLWADLTTSRGDLDILGSGTFRTRGEVHSDPLLQILGYVRRRYNAVCVDLSGSMEGFTEELLIDAKHIFLVCTQDIAGLHLARAKAELLRAFNLGDKVSIILNRVEKRSVFSIQEIEKLVGFRVRFSCINDDKRIADAVTAGTHVDTSSEVGKQFNAIATYMFNSNGSHLPKASHQRRFVEYFAITPQTFSFAPRKSE